MKYDPVGVTIGGIACMGGIFEQMLKREQSLPDLILLMESMGCRVAWGVFAAEAGKAGWPGGLIRATIRLSYKELGRHVPGKDAGDELTVWQQENGFVVILLEGGLYKGVARGPVPLPQPIEMRHGNP